MLLSEYASLREAASRTGMHRGTITAIASKGYALRNPDWDRDVKRVVIVKRKRWYLAVTPPSPEWDGLVDPTGRRVMYLSKIPGGPK